MIGIDRDAFDAERFAFPRALSKNASAGSCIHTRKRSWKLSCAGWAAGRRVGKTETVANIALQSAVRKPGTKIAIFATGSPRAPRALLGEAPLQGLRTYVDVLGLLLRAPAAEP
jgi:hypothetical protein